MVSMHLLWPCIQVAASIKHCADLALLQDRESVPDPESSNVRCKHNEGGLYAASVFSGKAESAKCQQKASELRQAPGA